MSVQMEHLVQATNRTLRLMADLEPSPGEVDRVAADSIFADVSAHLALLNGSEKCVVLTVSELVALQLVRRVAGADVTFDHPLVSDTVGELLNVIAGSAQKRSRFTFTIPVIATGRGHLVKVLSGTEAEHVRAVTPCGALDLYLVERVPGARHL